MLSIYLDIRKVIDSIPHQRLLLKLKGYDVDGELLRWIGYFFISHQQSVIINGHWIWVENCFQGTVLGSLLFIIYVNDIPSVVNNLMLMLADDMKIFLEMIVTIPKIYEMIWWYHSACFSGLLNGNYSSILL